MAGEVTNVFELESLAKERLDEDVYHYLAEGADDGVTLAANTTAFQELQIRARRLIDVSVVDTTTQLFGESFDSPIFLSPVGFQVGFHPNGEPAVARAAAARGHLMIVSSASTFSVGEISEAGGRPVWFQLYPTADRSITKKLLERAEAAGCPAVALTVDTPVLGNRQKHGDYLKLLMKADRIRMANYEGIRTDQSILDPSMSWDMVSWLKENSAMKVVLKGIVTREDATLALEHGADGLIVSNHGGRQEESNRGTIECLPEVAEAVAGRIPVLLDGGVRRGTDVLKALALGATAVGIGRPYIWGLAARGQAGVEDVLDILQEELVRAMQLAGAPSIERIASDHVKWK